ncbi:MAG: molybdopterin molybdotransferase MoeA, partial [Dehalococcoidales bacterium]
MKLFGALLSFEEAKKIVEEIIKPIDRVEMVDIDDAVGRILADNFVAALDTPPFNRSAMDGYAVRAEDTFGSGQMKPNVLEMVGTLHAGDTPSNAVAAGQCIQIATGAMMPDGADAVVMVEDTEAGDGRVKIFKPTYPKANVGKLGEDIKSGESVLKQGALLDAGKVGVLTSQGITAIKVYEKPRVAILPSGEEIAEIGSELKPGQLYDINSHTIASVVKENGGIPLRMGVVGDTKEDIRAKISSALDNDL